jgi:hypothetical protein
MKKNLIFIVAITVIAMISMQKAEAQSHSASVGSTYNYSVTQSVVVGTSTYNWSVITGTNGVEFTYNGADNDNSLAITWNVAGTYTVRIQEESSNSCPDPAGLAAQTITVTVTAAPEIAFASASSANCDGASGTNLTLNLSFTGTVVYPIVVNYTVAGGAARSRTLASGTTIDLGSEDNILDNATTSDIAKAVVITSATSKGASLTIGATSTHTYTVYGTPATSAITHD